jgi:hypothetical protein
MSKLVVALLIGTVIAMVILFLVVPFYVKNTLGQYTNPNYSAIQQDSEDSYKGRINSLLEQAGGNIEDAEMHQFYQKLIQDYGLDSSPSDISQSTGENGEDMLPDFQKIFDTSLKSPFQEAAKDITDEELAEVYHNILKGMLGTTASVD